MWFKKKIEQNGVEIGIGSFCTSVLGTLILDLRAYSAVEN